MDQNPTTPSQPETAPASQPSPMPTKPKLSKKTKYAIGTIFLLIVVGAAILIFFIVMGQKNKSVPLPTVTDAQITEAARSVTATPIPTHNPDLETTQFPKIPTPTIDINITPRFTPFPTIGKPN